VSRWGDYGVPTETQASSTEPRVNFIRVDLAWGMLGGSRLCLVRDGQVRSSTRVVAYADLVGWLEPHTQGPCLVAVDAPLIVMNATGRDAANG
jgi:predicted RNase H-like nuclease